MISTDLTNNSGSVANCTTKSSQQTINSMSGRHIVCTNCNIPLPSPDLLLEHRLTCPIRLSVASKKVANAAAGSEDIPNHVQPAPKTNNPAPKKASAGKKLRKCPFCNKPFARLKNYGTHLLSHTNSRPHQCNQCNKRFKLLSHLNRHKLTHTGKKNFTCKHCNTHFAHRESLLRHYRANSHSLVCQACGIEFGCGRLLKTHQSEHHKSKPLQCPHCAKLFILNRNLKKHMLVHTEKELFICEYCAKSFSQFVQLKNHLLTHNEGEPFVPEHCNIPLTTALWRKDQFVEEITTVATSWDQYPQCCYEIVSE